MQTGTVALRRRCVGRTPRAAASGPASGAAASVSTTAKPGATARPVGAGPAPMTRARPSIREPRSQFPGPQERRVVGAVANHRTGYIGTFPGEARDPGPDQASRPVAAGDEDHGRRLPDRRPRVRWRRHDRAPEAASGACQRLPAARRTSPGQLATRPRSSAVQLACPLVTLAGRVGGTQRATKPLADSRSMRLYPHRHYPGQSARRPGPAGCARYAPGRDARERVCAGQGCTGQQPPEP